MFATRSVPQAHVHRTAVLVYRACNQLQVDVVRAWARDIPDRRHGARAESTLRVRARLHAMRTLELLSIAESYFTIADTIISYIL